MDEKKLKALAAELAKGLKTEADLNQFSRMLTKLTVETALNAELTDHLGHEKNAPKSGSNTRNGYSSKTVLCDCKHTCFRVCPLTSLHAKKCCKNHFRDVIFG
ncbi:hypothetical protein Pcaca02_36230 [Pectobacterium carotovorum subsp. carotovorum]|nr:hypothetical protein Pcaca02_36230 [Pectobacterium carotovorum subsp. carotovorum]